MYSASPPLTTPLLKLAFFFFLIKVWVLDFFPALGDLDLYLFLDPNYFLISLRPRSTSNRAFGVWLYWN